MADKSRRNKARREKHRLVRRQRKEMRKRIRILKQESGR